MNTKLEYFYVSNIGLRRKKNQDNLICNEFILPKYHENTDGIKKGSNANNFNIFGVFDGLGGEKDGEVASYIAALTYLNNDENDSLNKIKYNCIRANDEISDYMDLNDIDYMGTTAAVLSFAYDKVMMLNIGDSKIFRIRDKKMIQLSKDHVDNTFPNMKPPLYQYIGIRPEEMLIEPYIEEFEYKENDCYLISSDGLTDMVTENRITEIINNNKEEAAHMLLQEALENGGRDNITFVLIYLK